MALPKRRFSRSRRDKRRLHLNLAAPTLTRCPQCGSPARPHRVCPACGTYRGRPLAAVRAEEKKG